MSMKAEKTFGTHIKNFLGNLRFLRVAGTYIKNFLAGAEVFFCVPSPIIRTAHTKIPCPAGPEKDNFAPQGRKKPAKYPTGVKIYRNFAQPAPVGTMIFLDFWVMERRKKTYARNAHKKTSWDFS